MTTSPEPTPEEIADAQAQAVAEAQARVAEAELEYSAAQGVVEAWRIRLEAAQADLASAEADQS